MSEKTVDGKKPRTHYELLHPGHELFVRIVQTVPEEIYEGELRFVAHGIKCPHRDSNPTDYLKECATKGVIPFSQIEVEYDDATELVVPKREADYFVDIDVHYSEEKQKAVGGAILKGGKIHAVSIGFPMFDNTFEAFRHKGLALLVASGYQISRGKFHFTEPNPMGCCSRVESFIEFGDDEQGKNLRVVNCASLDEWIKEVVYR